MSYEGNITFYCIELCDIFQEASLVVMTSLIFDISFQTTALCIKFKNKRANSMKLSLSKYEILITLYNMDTSIFKENNDTRIL